MRPRFVLAAATVVAIIALGRSASPSLSPTARARLASLGHAIVFGKAASDGLDARIEIAYVSARGGAVVSLTTAWKAGMVAAEPRWSPDGSRAAFVMSPLGHLTRYAGDGDIYAMDADGTDIHRLTDGLDASSPAWSPDGSRIAFVKTQGQELVGMRADGLSQHVIARARGYYQGPAWSPDGQTIAYQSSPNRNLDVTDIFTIHPDGTHERQLTPASASAGFPAWSPDGSRIAYSARTSSGSCIPMEPVRVASRPVAFRACPTSRRPGPPTARTWCSSSRRTAVVPGAYTSWSWPLAP